MKRFLITFLALTSLVFSQSYRMYGGCGMDWSVTMIQTAHAQYLAGGSNSFEWGDGDIWITKTDLNGNPIWTRTYRVDHNYDVPTCIAEAPDHRIWVGYNQHFLMTLDTMGNLIRTVDFGSDIFLHRMFSTLSGGMMLHGTRYDNSSSDRQPMVILMDTAGTVLDAAWYKVQEGNLITAETVPFSSGFQLPDSSFTFAGTGYFPDLPFILHLEKDLSPSWHVSFDKLCNGLIDILPAPGGGYFLNSLSSDTLLYHRHPILFRTDASGTPEWVRTYNIDSNRWYTNASNPKFAIHNRTLYIGGNVDGPSFDHTMVLSVDTNGGVRWCHEFGDPDFRYDLHALQTVGDSVRALCTSNADTLVNQVSPYGVYQEDMLVFGVDSMGNASVVPTSLPVTWMNHSPDTTHYPVVMTRFTVSLLPASLSVDTAFTELTDSSQCIGVNTDRTVILRELPVIYPNPSLGDSRLDIPSSGYMPGTLEMYDFAGRKVAQSWFNPGTTMNLANPGPGWYMVRIPTEDGWVRLRWLVLP